VDPNWIDLQQELTEGPFAEKGFNKQLQLQIEHKLDQKQVVSKARYLKLGIASAAVFLIVLSLTRLYWGHSSHEQTASAPIMDTAQNANKPLISNNPPQVKSVLLLGLRTDVQEKNANKPLVDNKYSTYRTLMIAADPKGNQRLQIAAEGNGLLVPHGQQFWRVDALTQETSNDIYHYLTAGLASSKTATRSYKNTPDAQLHHDEKLVYAGNNYISIVTSEEAWRGNAPAASQAVWTRAIDQINTEAGNNANDHLSLQKILGKPADAAIAQIKPNISASQGGIKSAITGDNWTLVRENGKWVPQIAEVETLNNNAATSYELHSFPLALPDTVVSHDQLVMTWDAVKQAQPDALDAISSPDEDMLAIITADKLYIYPYGNNELGPLALQIALHNNESMVMAQWATAKYADNWIEEGKRYLKK
jgi:hypothetical protein